MVGERAGEPGFEPGFTVLETARIAINSLPCGAPMVPIRRLDPSLAAAAVPPPDDRCGRRDSNPHGLAPTGT
jgi:hypothetical protein